MGGRMTQQFGLMAVLAALFVALSAPGPFTHPMPPNNLPV